MDFSDKAISINYVPSTTFLKIKEGRCTRRNSLTQQRHEKQPILKITRAEAKRAARGA